MGVSSSQAVARTAQSPWLPPLGAWAVQSGLTEGIPDIWGVLRPQTSPSLGFLLCKVELMVILLLKTHPRLLADS